MAREGYDYSWGRPSGAAIRASGRDFVVRYLFDDGQGGKGLDQSEVNDLQASGIAIALVYEEYAKSFTGTAAGVSQAQKAQAALNKLSLDKNLPIYFAVDWDTTEADQVGINAALDGAASVIGKGRVGVYGSFYVMNRAKDHATWFWQTYAWSGGQVASHIHLYQYKNGQTLSGHAVDFTRALKDQFGQTTTGATTPTPAPSQPLPPTATTQTYTVKKGDTLSGIAAKYGTTYQHLAAINGISNPNLIYAGQVLKIDGTTAATPASTTIYVVKKGDTLSNIAAKYGTTYQHLARVNGIANPNIIYPGQSIKIQ